MDIDTAAARPPDPPASTPAGTPREGSDRSEIVRILDDISLRQALLDFEVANARVLDLTARLVEANARAARFSRLGDDAEAARTAADERARAAEERAQGERAELESLRLQVGVLAGEIDAHRDVIAARDRDQATLHLEIAARDEAIRARMEELAALKGSRAYRLAERLGSLARIGRRWR